jgi:hypothetical protein
VVNYVDGATATLVKAVINNGAIGVTVTGVESSPAVRWAGLYTVKDSRTAVTVSPGSCCTINDSATWSAKEFRPLTLNPGQQGAVAVHLLESNCEFNSGGQYVILDSIRVHYSVLGFAHIQDVGIGPYWFKSPEACPRSGFARP